MPSESPTPATFSVPAIQSRSFAQWAPDALIAFANSRGAEVLAFSSLSDNVDQLRVIWISKMIVDGASDEEIIAFDIKTTGMIERALGYVKTRKARALAGIERKRQEAAALASPEPVSEPEQPQDGNIVNRQEDEAEKAAMAALWADRGHEVST